MQTIARANRVFPDSSRNGLIVDYVGVFRNLEKALAIYSGRSDRTGSQPGTCRSGPKADLVAELAGR